MDITILCKFYTKIHSLLNGVLIDQNALAFPHPFQFALTTCAHNISPKVPAKNNEKSENKIQNKSFREKGALEG